jgi:hypothetical protein
LSLLFIYAASVNTNNAEKVMESYLLTKEVLPLFVFSEASPTVT